MLFDAELARLMEEALVEYVERYGLTEKARSALVLAARDKGKASPHEIR